MRCPYCFYEMIAEPGWMKTLMALFRKQSKPKGQTVELERDAMPLTFLKPHVPARIDHLRMEERTKLKELIAMGILPGAKVMLLRKFPSYVFQIGQSQFSFDAELAATIYVKLLAG